MDCRLPLLLLGCVVAAGCSGNQLSPATLENTVDTVTMGSLRGADLRYPAAFDIVVGQPVRTDQTSSFDFIYTVDTLGRHLLIPLAAIPGLASTSSTNPGFVRSTTMTFAQIGTASTDTYLTTDSLVIAPGDVLFGRSRISSSCYLGVPQYAKFQVLDFDDSLHTVRLEVLADLNCGYKDLQPGIPTN